MYYIVFDMEFNQDFSSVITLDDQKASYPSEIIQIGAVKLDADFNTKATFNRFVKPTLYSQISPFITELTGITTGQLSEEEPFPKVYEAFLDFIEADDSIFCVWGMTDMKELFRTTEYFKLEQKRLPKQYINLQPYASLHFNQSQKKLLRLQSTVEALTIPQIYPFHNALHDAFYTAEVLKVIWRPSIQPKLYDPIHINV